MVSIPATPHTAALSSWVLTDGKAGDELQCLAVAEALGLEPAIRRIAPRPPFTWAMPWGPIDPRERPQAPGSPLSPPYPAIVLASGRRAVPYLRYVKRASGGRSFTVFLKDPRTGPAVADLIWAPSYDRIRGPNVVTTLTPPHRISPARLAAERSSPDPRLAGLPHPRVAVLAGGRSRHHRFTAADCARLLGQLADLAASGASLMVTASRRTPDALAGGLARLARESGGFFWDGAGPNPYVALLALADFIVATADSANMVGEAAATGTPILLFEPGGGHPKLRVFVAGLRDYGAVHPFCGRLEGSRYEPLDSTSTIARAVREGLARHRRALGLPEPALVSETF
jgi:mitochondrial fission protein ELM1